MEDLNIENCEKSIDSPTIQANEEIVIIESSEKEPEKTIESNNETEQQSKTISKDKKTGNKKIEGMLDLAFSVDNTGSMEPYINAVQQHIREIIEQIVSSEQVHVRFALVMYRDHKPQDNTFVTRVHDFTSSLHQMQNYVSQMKAAGGGDGPESVADSFYEVLRLSWRENATKICIHISDAPPHGLEPHGDGFPNGCPCGHDPFELAKQMLQKGITVYTVGCDGISSFQFAKDFMISIAEITQGQAIALSSASMLANVILGGTREEICLEKLTREVQQEMERLQQRGVDEELIVEEVTKNLQLRGIQSKHMKLNGIIRSNVANEMNNCSNLAEVRSKIHVLKPQSPPVEPFNIKKKSFSLKNSIPSFRFSNIFRNSISIESAPVRSSEELEESFSPPPLTVLNASIPLSSSETLKSDTSRDEWVSSTECKLEEDLISYEQVRRVMNKTSKEMKYHKR